MATIEDFLGITRTCSHWEALFMPTLINKCTITSFYTNLRFYDVLGFEFFFFKLM